MLLRPGNAGSNTVADHIRVLADAFDQIPAKYRKKILVRVDGAGATHELLQHLDQMNTLWRTVRFTVGWTITATDEAAIAVLPETDRADSLRQDATATTAAGVAELTGLHARAEAWTPGLRLIARGTKPSAAHQAKLTALERKTGWRYAIVATNITRIWGIPGSHHPQWIDALHRCHATVEDRVRTNKAMGLPNLPSQSWKVNRSWVLAANLAADSNAWTRLLGLHDQPLVHAEPETPAIPPLAPARQTHPPRPPPVAHHQRNLAMGRGVHALLAATDGTTRARLTRKNRPYCPERAVPTPGDPAPPQRHAGDPPSTPRDKTGVYTLNRACVVVRLPTVAVGV
jgi:hypothetical protein